LEVVTSIIPEVGISTRSENLHAQVRGKEILRDTEGPDRATKVLQLQHRLYKKIADARGQRIAFSAQRSRLGVQKLQDRFCVFFAERCSYTHVPDNRSRDTGRETFRRIVTAGTILFEFLCAFARL